MEEVSDKRHNVDYPVGAISQSQAHTLEVVPPGQANHYGTLYGANALQMMGKAAFVCATRYARCPVVMAKADNIEFRRPVRLGEIIDIGARVAFRGRSSMTVLVDMVADDADGAEPAISGRFMMVAVDSDGAPVPIPDFDQSSTQEVLS